MTTTSKTSGMNTKTNLARDKPGLKPSQIDREYFTPPLLLPRFEPGHRVCTTVFSFRTTENLFVLNINAKPRTILQDLELRNIYQELFCASYSPQNSSHRFN